MTVSNTPNSFQYTGNGTTTLFAYGNVFFVTSDLVVTLFDTVANAAVSPAPVLNGSGTYDYTVTGTFNAATGEFPNGTVTFNNAPLSNHRITLSRAVPPTQQTQLLDNAKFPAAAVNAALDRLTILVQQNLATLASALQFPASDPLGLVTTLPAASLRANDFLGFDSLGNVIATPGPLTGATVSSAMVPVVEAATLASALGLLGGLAGGAVNALAALTTLKSTTAGAAAETFFTLLRNKGAGAASDFLERLAFDGMNGSTAQKTFAAVLAQIVTATAGGEAGALLFQTIVGGALGTAMTLQSGLQLGTPTGGDKGAGTINAAGGIFINGTAVNNAITLGTENVMNPLVLNSVSAQAHGLARKPDFVFAWFECLTADQGYATGDRLMMGNQGTSAGISQQAVQADATNTRLILDGAAPSTISKSGGAGGNMTLANWKFVAAPVVFGVGPF